MTTHLYKWVLAVVCMISAWLASDVEMYAQTPSSDNSVVEGVVSDQSGAPLAGVAALVQGNTSVFTITDAEGMYRLEGLTPNSVIEFSCLGMIPVTVTWNGERRLDVTMEEESLELEATVVIGYGSVKKKDLTGSVGILDGESLQTSSTTLLSQRLQGMIPGLNVSRTGSMPGTSATLQIRGVTTMSDNSPLILIDGMPASSIDDVNSLDIDQITVLKDAASASIYGARAAAGVILITTKSASEGETVINYSGEVSFHTLSELPESVGALDYMRMYNEMQWNDAGNPAGGEYNTYTQDFIDNYYMNHGIDPITYPLTDWKDLMLKDFALRHKHSLVLTYGNKVVKTRASVSYENSDALFKGRNYERITARLRNNIRFSPKWSANIDMSINRSQLNNTQASNVIKHAYMYPAIYLAEYPDGRIAEGQSGANTYAILKEGGNTTTNKTTFSGKVSLEFRPIEGLSFEASFLPSLGFNQSKDFKKAIPIYDAYDPNLLIGYINNFSTTSLTEARRETVTLQGNLVATYAKSFAMKHNLNVMAGYEEYYYRNEYMSGSTDQMVLDNYPYLDRANENFLGVSGTAYENAYRSYFARAMYNYDSRYYVQFNARFDGSSRFHRDYRWGFFPSASVGWVASEEGFLKDVNWLSFLKVRASVGSLGNERIGNYPYQTSINFESTPMFGTAGIVSQMAAAQVEYAVRDITWETTYNVDAGIDANFFDNRLTFTGDYYYKKTVGMLLETAIPSFTGFADPEQNAGEMSTQGWEIKLGWSDRKGDFSYSVGVNLSNYYSVMGNLNGTVFDGEQIIREGSEYLAWYGYRSSGLFQTADEVANSALLITNTKPGDIKYVDVSGADGAADNQITADYDRVILGSSQPKYIYGGYFNLGWKGISFSMTFSGVGKQLARMNTSMIQPFEGSWLSPSANLLGNYWSLYNTAEQNSAARYPRLTSIETNNYAMSDFWLFNGAFFRCKNINLGYTFPSKWIKKAGIESLGIYINVDDPFCIDNYPKGWDPEASVNTYITTTYTLGLDIKF